MTDPRVLLVDDDRLVIGVIERLLRVHCTPRIMVALNVTQALDYLEACEFELIVVDLRLPGIDGATLLELAAKRWPAMRRAILTGAIDDWPAHADAVLLKGSNPADIVATICDLARNPRE